MRSEERWLEAADGTRIFVHHWSPDRPGPPRGSVQIAHGMAEQAGRYARVAERLTAAGYEVWADDHRGHGRTAGSAEELGHLADRGGWELILGDLAVLHDHVRRELPDVPRCLLGHSMGSFMAQDDLTRRPGVWDAVVLSGSNVGGGLLIQAGRLVARLERLRLGRRGRSGLLQAMSFGAWNRAFAPNRTEFDWLSRDAAEVDAYAEDPLCGFVVTTQLWVDLFDALARLGHSDTYEGIPRDLPLLVIAGDRDPVSDSTKGLERLLERYRRAGLQKVTHRFYEGARHELFNETNRDEVLDDLVAWLDDALAPQAEA
jgi:alpha-beta hydrolase superfamily lysophospholipase